MNGSRVAGRWSPCRLRSDLCPAARPALRTRRRCTSSTAGTKRSLWRRIPRLRSGRPPCPACQFPRVRGAQTSSVCRRMAPKGHPRVGGACGSVSMEIVWQGIAVSRCLHPGGGVRDRAARARASRPAPSSVFPSSPAGPGLERKPDRGPAREQDAAQLVPRQARARRQYDRLAQSGATFARRTRCSTRGRTDARSSSTCSRKRGSSRSSATRCRFGRG